jgi:hypothetical protein
VHHKQEEAKNLRWLIIIGIFIVVLGIFSFSMIELKKSFAYINQPKAITQNGRSSQAKTLSTAKKPSTIQSCKYWFKKVDTITVKRSKKNVWMRYIMYCESGCNPTDNTKNKYFGLYNFTKNTFRGKGGTNIFDGRQQINIVSKMYDLGPAYRSMQFNKCNRAFIRDWNKSH